MLVDVRYNLLDHRMLGWIGNAFIIVGMVRIGRRCRDAFLWSAFGEGLWVVDSVAGGRWNLCAICIIFIVMALRNFHKWGAESVPVDDSRPPLADHTPVFSVLPVDEHLDAPFFIA